MGVATDSAGNVYMGGETSDSNSIASGGFQNTYSGAVDAFLVKFDADGNRLWATYYGGGDGIGTTGSSVATDAAGNVYLAGTTVDNIGIASGGFQNVYGGGEDDVYLVKFNGAGNRLWATYYGGPNEEETATIATDALGNVYMGGHTESPTGIASGGFENILNGREGMFAVKFNSAGNRQCATYYAIDPNDIEGGYITVDASGNVYLANATDDSTGVASGGFENNFGSSRMALYLVKFCPCISNCNIIPPVANFQSSDSTFCTNECINYTDLSTNATSWQWSFPGGIPSSSTMQNPQGICYDTAGTFNATLIASNAGVSDTLNISNYIKVRVTPPTPVITQHHDTLFCTTDPSYTSYQWYDSTTLIPGATDTFLIITHGGNYNVAVSNEFGCKISVGITIAHDVGINEFSDNNYISLSPNPATDELFISGNWKSGVGKEQLTIINLIGQIIYTQGINRQSETINCKPFPAGIYFVCVANESERWVGRFVKE